MTPQWKLEGDEPATDAQKRMLNAVAGDLSAKLAWPGQLSKDDWRHMLSALALGARMVPGPNMGLGPSMFILGRSSLDLSVSKASEAISNGLAIGDDPHTHGLKDHPRIQWSDKVLLGLGLSPSDLEAR